MTPYDEPRVWTPSLKVVVYLVIAIFYMAAVAMIALAIWANV